MTASIIAITTLAKNVVSYLNDMKDASKEQARVTAEISTVDALLTPLQYRIKSTQSGDPWFTEVQRLGVKGGPLEQFKSTLMQLKSKVEQPDRYKKAVGLLSWTFSKTEVSAMLSRVERVKTLVSLALANDIFTLSQKIQEDLSDICADVSHISGRVTDMQSMLDDQERRASDQERRIIVEWLSPLNFKATQSEVFSQRQDGTGQWLLESEKFKDWVDGTKEGLWCPGIPGAGKTILASIVTNYLRTTFKRHDIAIACIYYNYKDQNEQTDLNLIGSLLKQLVQGQSDISSNIKGLYNAHVNEQTPPTHAELTMALKSEIETFSKVFVVVDALDECLEGRRANLVDMLLSLPETVKLMVTSRPLSTIEAGLEGMTRLDIRADDSDVRLYVEGRIPHEKRLARHVRKDPTLGETLVGTIVNSARGMFLLAQLYMDSLVSKNNADAIREALQHPPEKLEDTYEEAMARILKQSREDRELAFGVISWISFAVRPLSIEELQHALAVRPGDTYLRRGAFPDEEIMISVCVGLVIIDESGIIRLVHYTAQEYFDQTRESKFPNAQINITLTCATYLSFDVFEMGPCTNDAELETRLRDYSLLNYAANNWGHHAQGDAEETCQETALVFLQHNLKILCASQVMHTLEYRYPGYSEMFPRSVSGLHVAAGFGMRVIVDSLLKLGTGADSKDSGDRTPLSWAAEKGHLEIVKLLVGVEGVDRDSKDNHDGQTPLSWAAEQGHLETVKLLVGVEGVDRDSKDNRGRTPLSRAAEQGHLEIVKLLVGVEGVDRDSKDNHYGRTPLSWAAEQGHLETVKLLVGVEGVDRDSKDNRGQTPLSQAAEHGHLEIVKLLVGVEGVDRDSKDNNYGQTPLSQAAEHGHLEIVKLLVGVEGVDRDSKDNYYGRTPLSWAANRGHLEIVKLLTPIN
ncbi:MAG: hypothetical protein M1840_004652 [Geoglossum simile]|nr:MAG: hypothetical protein M1840_004652 [Geoglossum simile]